MRTIAISDTKDVERLKSIFFKDNELKIGFLRQRKTSYPENIKLRTGLELFIKQIMDEVVFKEAGVNLVLTKNFNHQQYFQR